MTTPQREPGPGSANEQDDRVDGRVDDRVEGDPAADEPQSAGEAPAPHPPFARAPEDYTDPPGHHRRSDGAATDVGA